MPQQTIGSFNLAVPQSLADQGGADDLPILPLQRHNDDFDAILLPELAEQFGIAGGILAKVEVLPAGHNPGLEAFRQHLPDKLLRRQVPELLKGRTEDLPYPHALQDILLDLIGLDQFSHRLGAALSRRGKGEYTGDQSLLACRLHRCGDHLGMSAVDAVKEAQRHCGGTLRQMRGQSI